MLNKRMLGASHSTGVSDSCNASLRLKTLHDIFEPKARETYGMETKSLYVVSLDHYPGLTQTILLEPSVDINAEGGYYGNALQAAAATTHLYHYAAAKEVIQILLGAGADVNGRGGRYGSALQAAAAGHPYNGLHNRQHLDPPAKEIVQMLLDTGADVNVQGGFYGSALQAAA
jgi:hypothetical protein